MIAGTLGPVTLSGAFVRLEPLRSVHLEHLVDVARDDRIWKWLPARLQSRADLERFVAEAEKSEEAGEEYPFAVISQRSGRAIGSTRYMDIVPDARGVEIGWTWYAPEVWGTKINPEAKYLLMRHAFEIWRAIRVCFKTDELNERSRGALLRLGARFEGVLRNHRIRRDGSYRGSAYYSVLEDEWPRVAAGLLERMGQRATGG